MDGADERGNAQVYQRCYCIIQHEYQKFSWFDEGEEPHIINSCDGFLDCQEEEVNVPHHVGRHTQEAHTQEACYAMNQGASD